LTVSGVSEDVSINGFVGGGDDAWGRLWRVLLSTQVPLGLVFWIETGIDVIEKNAVPLTREPSYRVS
jgi:hypothetical protein